MRMVIAVDFDDTLCESSYPHAGEPKPGAKESMEYFKTLGFQLHIYSCRACHWDYDLFPDVDPTLPVLERPTVQAMVQFLERNRIPYDSIDDGSKGKPNADFFIDDKGVRFNNNWPEVAAFVRGQLDLHARRTGTVSSTVVQELLPFNAGEQEVAA